MNGNRPSQRSSARASSRTPSASGSGRTATSTASTRGSRKAGGSSGTLELIIGISIIAVLSIICAAIYFAKSKERREAEETKRRIEAAHERNLTLAAETFRRAAAAGLDFVTGKTPDAKEDTLFGGLRSDQKLYNVIFERSYRDSRMRQLSDQKFLYPERKEINRGNRSETRDGVQITKGRIGTNDTAMIAQKSYPPPEQQTKGAAHLGGEITIIVLGEKEE